MDKLIIGLVGEKFAGKDVVANFLAEKHGATHIRFSHIFDEILDILDLPISRENEIALGNGIRSRFGEAVFVPAVVKRIKNSKTDLIVINGIRLIQEYSALKNLDAKFIYITASYEIRFERYLKRREKADDALMNFEEFKQQETTHTEMTIPTLGGQADFRIDNEGSLEELYGKVEKIMSNLNL